MKKIAIGVFIILILSGCGKSQEDNLAKEVITAMLTETTYTQLEQNEDNLPILLEQYFSDDGYRQFVTEKVGYIYPEFLRLSKALSTENIQLKKIKTSKQKESTQLIYKVEYSVVYKDKKTKMHDTITLKIDNKNRITELLILNTSDIIRKMFLDLRIM